MAISRHRHVSSILQTASSNLRIFTIGARVISKKVCRSARGRLGKAVPHRILPDRSRRNTRGDRGWRAPAGESGSARGRVGEGETAVRWATGSDRAASARFANVLKNPLIPRGVYMTVCQYILLINKKNFNPSPSSAESSANLTFGVASIAVVGRSSLVPAATGCPFPGMFGRDSAPHSAMRLLSRRILFSAVACCAAANDGWQSAARWQHRGFGGAGYRQRSRPFRRQPPTMLWAPRFPARPAQIASTLKMAPRIAAICSVVARRARSVTISASSC